MTSKLFVCLVFVFIFCRCQCNNFSTLIYPFKIEAKFDEAETVDVNWIVDYEKTLVNFAVEIAVRSFEWLAVGFSEEGDFYNSDLCVWSGKGLEVSKFRTALQRHTILDFPLKDTWVEGNGAIKPDAQQDCLLRKFQELPDGRIILLYSRKFNTGDPADVVIEPGTTQFVVAYGKTLRKNIFGKFVEKKLIPNRIFKDDHPPPHLPPNVQTLEVRSRNATIPAEVTTYWCTVMKLPNIFFHKHHIVKFEAAIQPENAEFVHHMEVFHCERPASGQRMPLYDGHCLAENLPAVIKSCRRVVGAWAMGAEPFDYPKQAGIPIGGAGYYPFVMVEIHYNNVHQKSGVIDSSGMRFYYTSQLRQYDAGILEVGLEYSDRMAIPPEQKQFSLTGYCTADCTELGLPPTGITLFASQLHSHLTGRKLETLHVRENVPLTFVNKDDHYSPHWQEIRHIRPVHVLPGDSLVTTCQYNTLKRKNITLGGFGITDEMCVNYIHYFPKSELEVCKSAVEPETLNTFFRFMKRLENQPTNIKNNATMNYKAIDWNPTRIDELRKFYQRAPMKAECRKNNGDLYQVEPQQILKM